MPRPGNIKRDLEILAKLTALKMGVLQRQIADQPDVDLSQLQQYRTAPLQGPRQEMDRCPASRLTSPQVG